MSKRAREQGSRKNIYIIANALEKVKELLRSAICRASDVFIATHGNRAITITSARNEWIGLT